MPLSAALYILKEDKILRLLVYNMASYNLIPGTLILCLNSPPLKINNDYSFKWKFSFHLKMSLLTCNHQECPTQNQTPPTFCLSKSALVLSLH